MEYIGDWMAQGNYLIILTEPRKYVWELDSIDYFDVETI